MSEHRPTPLSSPTRVREVLHELRAPLGGIRAMIDLLRASALDEHQREIVRALDASASHLRAVADGVLGAGEDASATHAHPLRGFLESIVFGANLRAAAKGTRVTLNMEDEALAGLEVGSHALRQVIENLLDNAIRLSAEEVSLMVARRSASRLQFAVFDRGPGLTMEQADRLIRDGGGIEGRPGGAGIGLSICGRIVAEHGGRLEGGPGDNGQGACLTFDWPDGQGACAPEGVSCLIVDDHPASRLVLRTILGAAGYHVLEAGDPREALAVFGRYRPQLVLSDLNMPNGGGQGLIFRLATLVPEMRPHLIVISADEVSVSDPLYGVIDAQVRKPISVEAVLAAVGQVRARAAA